MERPKTENLTAWITGRNLNVFQKADAVIEYNKLLDYVKVIEEQLNTHDVVGQSEQLKAFVEEFIEAWEDGNGGDSDLYRKAKSL